MFSAAQPAEDGDVRWVEFAIVLSDPGTVYFQNSSKYLFHYEFAVEHLPGAIAAELDELALPYLYDAKPVDSIKLPSLREHIERVGASPFSPMACL